MRPSLRVAPVLVVVLATGVLAQEPAARPDDRPDELVPFLVGSSHPEIVRPPATPSEISTVRRRAGDLLERTWRPGRQETRDFTDRLVGALAGGKLLYADAMHVQIRVEGALYGARPDERTIRRTLADIESTLADTPLKGHGKHAMLRCIRELLASAKNELP